VRFLHPCVEQRKEGGVEKKMVNDKTDDAIYRELQEHLDKLPVGFPRSDSGAEIRVLKFIFTPKEAQIAANLSRSLETAQVIHARISKLGMTVQELGEALDMMVSKGGINFKEERGRKFYANVPFVIGMYDHQVKRMTRQFFKDVLKYDLESFSAELFGTKIPQLRTIPMEASITPQHYISRYDELRKIVETSDGPFSVQECVCRKAMSLIDRPCKKTSRKETCIALGSEDESGVKVYIDQGWGREITREECLEVLHKNEEDGLVLQVGNSERPGFICSCCGDCCGFLAGFNMMPKPVDFASSNYQAEVNAGLCAGCKTCVERCPMGAVKVVDDVAKVDLNRCIGCGLCVPTCEAKAMHLVKKDKQVTPPKTRDDLLTSVMNKRNEIRQRRV
jgi:Pyruvate/2-oxoacid:ferredoxin oxidoreductase delta subunit